MVTVGHFFVIGARAPLPGAIPVTMHEPGEGHADRRCLPSGGGTIRQAQPITGL